MSKQVSQDNQMRINELNKRVTGNLIRVLNLLTHEGQKDGIILVTSLRVINLLK
jgi:hypothetical protein